jgi:predicted nucleic acid-binding protein
LRLVLADTSAWSRSDRAEARWTDLLEASLLAVCTPIVLELLFSARSRAERDRVAGDLSLLPSLPIDRTVERIALGTQAALTSRSQHRGPTPVDLLIAAIAEVNGATLLHYDRHFDMIARVTGQPMEWLARRGSLD